MKLHKFNLNYSSDNFEFRSLNESDLDGYIEWFRKWHVREECRDKVNDDEVKDIVKRHNSNSLSFKSIMLLVFKNNELLGSVILWNNTSIKFRVLHYKKPVYNIIINFIDEISNADITTCIRVVIDAVMYFKLKIKTLYIFIKYYEHLINNFITNGFEKLEREYFYIKMENFLEKRGLENPNKTSNILIKSLC
jgi:hypothetical protein